LCDDSSIYCSRFDAELTIVTVCKPVDISDNSLVVNDLNLVSGDIKRIFIDVPHGSNFARIVVNGKQRSPAIFFAVATQIVNQSRFVYMLMVVDMTLIKVRSICVLGQRRMTMSRKRCS
jgi:hypothetical protein